MTTVKMLNDAEVAATRKLGSAFGEVQAKIATIFKDCEEIVVAALTRAGQAPDKKAKSVTGKRKDAIAKFKGEFVAEFVSGCPDFVAAVGGALKKEMSAVTPAEWKKYCATFKKGKPSGRLGTVYNELSKLFISAGYKTTFKAEAEGAEGGEGEEDAPVQEEVKVDVSSVAALVKFFADRKVPVENIVDALAIHAVACNVPLPAAKVMAMVPSDVVIGYATHLADQLDAAKASELSDKSYAA